MSQNDFGVRTQPLEDVRGPFQVLPGMFDGLPAAPWQDVLRGVQTRVQTLLELLQLGFVGHPAP